MRLSLDVVAPTPRRRLAREPAGAQFHEQVADLGIDEPVIDRDGTRREAASDVGESVRRSQLTGSRRAISVIDDRPTSRQRASTGTST